MQHFDGSLNNVLEEFIHNIFKIINKKFNTKKATGERVGFCNTLYKISSKTLIKNYFKEIQSLA